ncbi:hypothetical protein EVAR_47087_1 [Eumeta japonica]|uniref:Uncharacterized protein n=1 Tax=Eumeta variegata TaxID=151549 RepID=A0A4C1YCY7_EUMVA|nr:hypothetical protein EVAR_47087_1 [Eumeta japonica]
MLRMSSSICPSTNTRSNRSGVRFDPDGTELRRYIREIAVKLSPISCLIPLLLPLQSHLFSNPTPKHPNLRPGLSLARDVNLPSRNELESCGQHPG